MTSPISTSLPRLLALMIWVEESGIPETWIELQWIAGGETLPEGYWVVHIIIQNGRSEICVDIGEPAEIEAALGRLSKILQRYHREQRENMVSPD